MFHANDRVNNRAARVSMALFRISQAIKKITQEDSDEVGLSPVQIQSLLFIFHTRPDMASVGHLASAIGTSHVTAVKIINGLMSKGLVTKMKYPGDKRITILQLTDSGLGVVLSLDSWGERLQDALLGISEETMEHLEIGLGGIIHALRSEGYLVVAEPCMGCMHFRPNTGSEAEPHYCNMIHKFLTHEQTLKECPEHTRPPGTNI